jgi:hypothetical protein
MTTHKPKVALGDVPLGATPWALAQKAAANRQVISGMRRRLAAGQEVARLHQEPGLAWLERHAESPRTWSPNANGRQSATADVMAATTAAAV